MTSFDVALVGPSAKKDFAPVYGAAVARVKVANVSSFDAALSV